MKYFTAVGRMNANKHLITKSQNDSFKTTCNENSIIIIQYQIICIWNKYKNSMINNITGISFKSHDVWTWSGPLRGNYNLEYLGIRDSSSSTPKNTVPTHPVPYNRSQQES